MGIKKCDIFYENNSDTFYSGQTINGRIDFTFDSPKKVRGIHIQLKGEANVFWQETENRKNANGQQESYIVHFNSHEEYFKIKYYLAGSNSGSEITFPTGTHSFPFTCALPPNLPTSFEGENGFVRYTIKVTLDRPWKFDQEYKFAFTVISVLDLNLRPDLKNPVRNEKTETFCCCCCESGPFSMTVSMPCSGFVSGQKIPIHIDCDNASNVKIKYIKLKLQKDIQYHSHSPRRETKKTSTDLITKYLNSIECGENVVFDETIIIPPLPPSNLENCSIIDIKYGIWIKAKVGGCHESPCAWIPITIGTIPIHDLINELRNENEDLTDNVKQPLIGSPTFTPTQHTSYPPAEPPTGTVGWNQNLNQPSYNPYVQPDGGQQPPYPTAASLHPPPVEQNNLPYPTTAPYLPNSQTTPYPPPYPPPPINYSLPPTLPPPVFQESEFKANTLHGKEDNQYTNIGTQNFAPRYPVYVFPPSAPPPPPPV